MSLNHPQGLNYKSMTMANVGNLKRLPQRWYTGIQIGKIILLVQQTKKRMS